MSKKSFDAVSSNYTIYDGFADGIRALNEIVAPGSQYMKAIPGGRGYAKPGHRQDRNNPNIHTSPIHAMSIAENDPDLLLKSMAERKDFHGSIYMGAAGLLNLSFIAATRPGAAILFDVNPVQAIFWNQILPILAEEKTGNRFMDALVKHTPHIHNEAAKLHELVKHPVLGRLREDSPMMIYMIHTYYSSPLDQWRYHEKAGFMNWLRDPVGYAHLRAMAQRNAIGALTLDVLDKEGWQQLAQHLDTGSSGAPNRIKTIYLSNILDYLGPGYDYTFREDAKSSPVYARKVVSQVMENRDFGVITETADPAMVWPEDTNARSVDVLKSFDPDPS